VFAIIDIPPKVWDKGYIPKTTDTDAGEETWRGEMWAKRTNELGQSEKSVRWKRRIMLGHRFLLG
jgi:hypothetical protein